MSRTILESAKFDQVIPPHEYQGDLASAYYNLRKYRDGVFLVSIDGEQGDNSIAPDGVLTATLYEAKDAQGTSEQALTGFSITLGSSDTDSFPGVTRLSITMDSVSVGDTVTITKDGQSYTFTAAAAEDVEAREFDQSGTDAACATSFAKCVNDNVYGVPGLAAEANLAVVTLEAEEHGEFVFDVAVSDPTETIPTVLAMQGVIGVREMDLTYSKGYTHVGILLEYSATPNGSPAIAAALIRNAARHMTVRQAVADQYPG